MKSRPACQKFTPTPLVGGTQTTRCSVCFKTEAEHNSRESYTKKVFLFGQWNAVKIKP
jgi:hypothetical protein